MQSQTNVNQGAPLPGTAAYQRLKYGSLIKHADKVSAIPEQLVSEGQAFGARDSVNEFFIEELRDETTKILDLEGAIGRLLASETYQDVLRAHLAEVSAIRRRTPQASCFLVKHKLHARIFEAGRIAGTKGKSLMRT